MQIREQVLRAIGGGVLRPGEQLPTMRQMAVDLKVDLNTVRHAYDELEQTGAIVILRARGKRRRSRRWLTRRLRSQPRPESILSRLPRKCCCSRSGKGESHER